MVLNCNLEFTKLIGHYTLILKTNYLYVLKNKIIILTHCKLAINQPLLLKLKILHILIKTSRYPTL